jgi:methyl-accepting chemotaxis protein
MGDIVSQVQRVNDLIGAISDAAVEQTTGIQEVSGAMAALDDGVHGNATLVQQAAAAAEALREQAQALACSVAVFELQPA